MENYMTPKKASEKLGIHWQTLRNWALSGKIDFIVSPGGKRFYNVEKYIKEHQEEVKEVKEIKEIKEVEEINKKRKICYCRVSSYNQKADLENQIKYMRKKYPNYEILYDVGSGINFKRLNFNKIIEYGINNELETLVLAYKDRLCRIAFELIEELLKRYSKTEIIILNKKETNSEKELVEDMIEIITVFSSRLYGMRSYK